MAQAAEAQDFHRQLTRIVELDPATCWRIHAKLMHNTQLKETLSNPFPSTAQTSQPGQDSQDLRAQCDQKSTNLNSLTHVLTACVEAQGDRTGEKRAALSTIVRGLCESNLVGNLLTASQTLLEQIKSPTRNYPEEVEKAMKVERKGVPLCIFLTSQLIQFSQEECLKVLHVLKEAQVLLRRVDEQLESVASQRLDGEVRRKREISQYLNEFCYTMLMAVCFACFPRESGLIQRQDLDSKACKRASMGSTTTTRATAGRNVLLDNDNFIAEFAKFVQCPPWVVPSPGLLAANPSIPGPQAPAYQILLGVPLAIAVQGAAKGSDPQCGPTGREQHVDETFQRAHEYMWTAIYSNEAFRYLVECVLGSQSFEEDEYRDDYLCIWMSIIRYLISDLPGVIEDLAEHEAKDLKEYLSDVEEHNSDAAQQIQQSWINVNADDRRVPMLRQSQFGYLLQVIGLLHKGTHGQYTPRPPDTVSMESGLQHARPKEFDPYHYFMVKSVPQHIQNLYHVSHTSQNEKCWIFIREFEIAMFEMLVGLVESEEAANLVYHWLNSEIEVSHVKWDTIISTLGSIFGSRDQVQMVIKPLDLTVEKWVLAILKLIGNVAYYSADALALMRRDMRYDPLQTLVWFLGNDQVSPQLMGQVFETLSGFARRSDMGLQIANELTSAKVLMPAQSSLRLEDARGIRSDLKREADDRRYPETKGFLRLLHQLFLHFSVLPPTVGMPSFLPYLEYATNDVFRPCLHRAYDDPMEKWDVAVQCLKIMVEVMERYTPDESHFFQPLEGEGSPLHTTSMQGIQDGYSNGTMGMFGSSASKVDVLPDSVKCGFWLMRHILDPSPKQNATGTLLELLFWINQSMTSSKAWGLPRYTSIHQCLVLTLRLIELVLEREGAFIEANRQVKSHHGIHQLKPLSQTLIYESLNNAKVEFASGIPPGSDSQDLSLNNPILNVTDCLQSFAPDARLGAVRVLHMLASTHHNITMVFRKCDEARRNRKLQLFVEALYSDEAAKQGSEEDSIHVRIIRMILGSLRKGDKAPNMAHFLCGFDLDEPTKLQISERSVSCLDVIIERLRSTDFVIQNSYLASLFYEVVFRLVESPEITETIIRVLCDSDYFIHHIRKIHTTRNILMHADIARVSATLNQRCYVLQTVAIFLHIASSTKTKTEIHKGHVRAIVNALFHSTDSYVASSIGGLGDIPTAMQSDFGLGASMPEQQLIFMEDFLQEIDFPLLLERHQAPDPDHVVKSSGLFYDYSFRNCFHRNSKGVLEYNLRQADQELRAVLDYNQILPVADCQGQEREPRSRIQEVLHQALLAGLEANQTFLLYDAICNAMEGWARVVEIAMFSCHSVLDRIPLSFRDDVAHIILSLLQCTLDKLSTLKDHKPATTDTSHMVQCLKPLESILSRTATCLITNLRDRYNPFISTPGSTSGARLSNRECHDLLSRLLQCTIKDETTCRYRSNCYALIINYLEYATPTDSGVRFLDETLGHQQRHGQEQLTHMNQITIYSDPYCHWMIQMMAKDALDSPESGCKAIAWAVLDALVRHDGAEGRLMCRMATQLPGGQAPLLQAVNELDQFDPQLCEILEPSCINVNPLHIFEGLTSFLCSVASSPHGAEYLHETCGIIGKVTNLMVLERIATVLPIDGIKESDPHTNLPSIRHRCSSILLSLLQLVTQVFQQAHHNIAMASQCAEFVTKHSKILKHIFRRPHNQTTAHMDEIDGQALKEIYNATSLLNLLGSHRALVYTKVAPNAPKKFGLLTVLSRFSRQDYWKPYLLSPWEDPTAQRGALRENKALVRKIVRNIVEFIAKTCGAYGSKYNDGLGCTLPFEVSLSGFTSDASIRPSREDLSIVLHALQGCVDDLETNQQILLEAENGIKEAHNVPPPMELTVYDQERDTGKAISNHIEEYMECEDIKQTQFCTMEISLLLLYHHLSSAYVESFETASLSLDAHYPLAHSALVQRASRPLSSDHFSEIRRDASSVKDLLTSIIHITASLQAPQAPRSDFVARLCERIDDILL